MRYIFITILLLSVISCMEMEDANQDLCVSVFCGEILDEKINFSLYNNTEIDFEQLSWDIGGNIDTINVLPLQQFSCWYNYEQFNNNYFYARGISGTDVFSTDTIWFSEEVLEDMQDKSFYFELNRVAQSDKLSLVFFNDYSGECRAF